MRRTSVWVSLFRNSVIHKILSKFLQPFRYVGMARISPFLIVVFILICFGVFGWLSRQAALLRFQKSTGLSVLATQHVYLTQVLDGNLSPHGSPRFLSNHTFAWHSWRCHGWCGRRAWGRRGMTISCLEGSWMLKKASLRKNLLTNQEPRSERSSPCCTVSEYRFSWDVVFWPLLHSCEYPCSSQSFPGDKTAGVSSRTFIVKNISNSLTYTIASSCVCTSPLAVMTIVGLHDFVKVSISASLKSFLLIMCIDAPESTTNSLSSGLRVDGASKHPFSEGEKNAAFIFSFNF